MNPPWALGKKTLMFVVFSALFPEIKRVKLCQMHLIFSAIYKFDI